MGNFLSSKKKTDDVVHVGTSAEDLGTLVMLGTTDGIAPNKTQPKVVVLKAKHELDENQPEKVLDLLLIMDCTASMSSWIHHCKNTLIDVLDESCEEDGSEVRVAFVGYRDFCSPECERYDIHDFTYDHESMKTFIAGRRASGGGDGPEDVCGAFYQGLNLNWSEDSIKVAYFCADAPCHGKKYNGGQRDNYPAGNPDGFVLENLIKELSDREILLTCYKLNDTTEQMCKIIEKSYNTGKGAEDDGFEFIDIRGQTISHQSDFLPRAEVMYGEESAMMCDSLESDFAPSAAPSSRSHAIEDAYGTMTKSNLRMQKAKMYSKKGW